MESDFSLEDIFKTIRGGNRLGVEALYELHYNKLYGIAFSILKDHHSSEDAVHNIIYKFYKMDCSQFPTSNESTWLYSVVKNECLMILRGEKKFVVTDELPEIHLEDKNLADFMDVSAYNSMITSLDNKRKEVVTLKVLGDYTCKEIAMMLNKPIGTIQWLYHTSIKKLRVLLSVAVTNIVVFSVGLIYFLYDAVMLAMKLNANWGDGAAGPSLKQAMLITYSHISGIALLIVFFSLLIAFIYKRTSEKK